MPTVEASGGWWSWPKAGLGFAIPLMIYALWGTYVYFNYRHISATRSPDVPDDGGMMYLFVMLVVTVVALLALLIAAAVLCVFRRTRAVGVGMMIIVLLPLVLLAAHYVWVSMQIADAVGTAGMTVQQNIVAVEGR